MNTKAIQRLKEQFTAALYSAVKTHSIASFGGNGSDSYCISYYDKQLSVSVASSTGKPSQLILPFLKSSLGQPSKTYTKPNSMRNDLTMTYFIWDNKELSFK